MPPGKQLFAVILIIYVSLPISRWRFVLQCQFLNRIKKNHWLLICFVFSYCKSDDFSASSLSSLPYSQCFYSAQFTIYSQQNFFSRSLCPLKKEFSLDVLRFLAIPDPSNFQIFHGNFLFLVACLFYLFTWPPTRHMGS